MDEPQYSSETSEIMNQLDSGEIQETPVTEVLMPVAMRRLVRRVERRDRRIAGLERKIQRLEEALTWRTIDLESLSRNVRREVQDALCNVRMIPVFGGTRDQVITEVRNTPANSVLTQPDLAQHT
jgi:hypothetical protein